MSSVIYEIPRFSFSSPYYKMKKEAEEIFNKIFDELDETIVEEKLSHIDSLLEQGLKIEDIGHSDYITCCSLMDLSDCSQTTLEYVIAREYPDSILYWVIQRMEPTNDNIRALENSNYHHVLEEFLKRREDKLYHKNRTPKNTEILLGFDLIDMTTRLWCGSRKVLPIEGLMIDYTWLENYQGASDLIQNIRLLHRHGSPRASFKQMLKLCKTKEKLVEIWNITYGKGDAQKIEEEERIERKKIDEWAWARWRQEV